MNITRKQLTDMLDTLDALRWEAEQLRSKIIDAGVPLKILVMQLDDERDRRNNIADGVGHGSG